MLPTFLLSGLLALNPFRPAPAELPTPLAAAVAASVDPCRLYGSVYLETDPRRRSQCFGVVYQEPEEAFADVLVYQETNKLFADKVGLWYLTDSRDFADYVLFVTDNRNLADFSFHYTKARAFAGCRKQ
ncbi:DUF6150 family protein [Hymenobacter sp. 5516J-16]|uniref:DUF6150 family protein n=1 Tax=Hymenobacter sublimis TaxID=2933777 RepID=A0ABY4JAK4_9BACT|nr:MULTISPECIES: DUF6150 family protein [Hymenobacter]UOQ75807.1 DUF6150 family protein [Hymenobacter sp. 5516J-16]UPL49486.1 DUF6150 family protein [Hymenobacter sublimis]